jgi:hypothetical protein
MRSIIFLSAATVLSAIICFNSCSDKTTVIQNIYPADQVTMTGDLLAWRCGVGDPINNAYLDHRFGVYTKDTARITIVYSNGWCDTVYTDTLSHFERVVSKGLHQFIVETRYTSPDTFQVFLDRDTVVDLNIVYKTLEPSLVIVMFYYGSWDDTLGISGEWNVLQRLNSRLDYALELPPQLPQDLHRYIWQSMTWIQYGIPVTIRSANIFQLERRTQAILAADTAHTICPAQIHMAVEAIGYACMD